MAKASEWLDEARDDLKAAENLGQAKLYAAACFHCQQAAEKALKAALLKTSGSYPKSHSLKQLAEEAGVFEKMYDEIALLEGDYTVSRYPDVYGKPPRAIYDARAFAKRLEAASKVVRLVGR